MAGCLRIGVEGRNGLCVLRVSGELDLSSADEFVERADHAVCTVPGPVVVNLSGLTFIDARGARALAIVTQTLPDGRQVVLFSCPPHVRLVLDVLGMSLNYLPADYLPAENWIAPGSGTRELVNRVQDARLQASLTKFHAKGILARMVCISIRLANTRERTELIREQGELTVATARATRAALSAATNFPSPNCASPNHR